MMGQSVAPALGNVTVLTSDHGGHSIEEISELLLRRIISVAETAPPAIRAQAVEFQDSLRTLIQSHMAEAVRSDRLTLTTKLRAIAPNLSSFIEQI
jgi:hypothetical protein